MHDELAACIERYGAAWEWVDGVDGHDLTARFYRAPFQTLRGDGSLLSLPTEQEVGDFFTEVAAGFRARGFHHATLRIQDVYPLGARAGMVTVDWENRAEDGRVAGAWRQSYTLVRFPEGWRIVWSAFHVDTPQP